MTKTFKFGNPKKDEKGVTWSVFGGGGEGREENFIHQYDGGT